MCYIASSGMKAPYLRCTMRPAGWNFAKLGTAARCRPSWNTRCEAMLLNQSQSQSQLSSLRIERRVSSSVVMSSFTHTRRLGNSREWKEPKQPISAPRLVNAFLLNPKSLRAVFLTSSRNLDIAVRSLLAMNERSDDPSVCWRYASGLGMRFHEEFTCS